MKIEILSVFSRVGSIPDVGDRYLPFRMRLFKEERSIISDGNVFLMSRTLSRPIFLNKSP